jgi:hypothetical protein
MTFEEYRHIIEPEFWKLVDKFGPVHPALGTECWLWAGYAHPETGYASLRVALASNFFFQETVHRISYRIHHGPIPEDQVVMHACDVRSCVRGVHLSLGTNLDNIKDKMAKGRHPRGSQFAHAKLTEEKVAELLILRSQGWSAPALALRYGVTLENIMSIAKGRTWKHVEGPRE